MCDTTCTLAHSCPECLPAPRHPPTFPSTKATLYIQNLPHTSKITTTVRHLYETYQLRQHIIDSEKWHPHTFDLVHWSAIQQCMYRTTGEGRKSALKLTFKLWATNQVQSDRTRNSVIRHDHRCQRCRQLHEDYNHIYRCPNLSLIHI